jgi:hypothetical protein
MILNQIQPLYPYFHEICFNPLFNILVGFPNGVRKCSSARIPCQSCFHTQMGSKCEETADVMDIVCGQRFPVTGFILRFVGLHHKTFSATGIFTGRRTDRLFYCVDSNRGFWGALLARVVVLISKFFLFRLFSYVLSRFFCRSPINSSTIFKRVLVCATRLQRFTF